MSGDHRAGGGDRGAATAELALTLPLLVAVTIGLVWLLGVGAAQVRVVDAARETARAAARGESSEVAIGRGRQVAPPGSRVTLSAPGPDGRFTVAVSGQVRGPGGLFGFLPALTVHAEAVAAGEQAP